MGSLSPQENQTVYLQGGDSRESSYSFSSDQDDGHRAIYDYARIMHEHTKKQLTTATSSARRRSQPIEESGTASVSSAPVTAS